MSSQTFNLSLPEELVKKLDARAKKNFSSRSEYVRHAVINQLKLEDQQDAKFTGNKPVKDTEADNDDVIAIAKDIIKRYKKDFDNLAQR